MKKILQFDAMDLQVFAEGAGGADGGTTGTSAAGVTVDDAGQQNTGVETDPAEQGTVAADAGQEQQDPEAAFDALIKGQYKDQFNAVVKKIVDGRVSGLNKQLQSYSAGQAVFDILAQKYGLDPTDHAGIAAAAEEDRSFVEKEAFEKGSDVEDTWLLRKRERENASMRRQMEAMRKVQEEQNRHRFAREQEEVWSRQAEETKKIYPGFDMNTELANPTFQRLLKSGVPVKAAYQVIHMDEVMNGAMQHAAQQAAKQVTDNVIAGAARPAENGTAAQAVSAKVDPSKFTSKDIKEYRERAARGERITF